jgi:hypothetical protein
MELSTVRRNNKTFRVFEKKRDTPADTSRRGRDLRSSSLSPQLTLIIFIAICAFMTFWLFASMNSKPINNISESYESESPVTNFAMNKKKGAHKQWTIPIASQCQNVKYSLMFCDSNGRCCPISNTNLSSGCCLASSSPLLEISSPQFHADQGLLPSSQRFSCQHCDEESSCCNEYHSCLSCCQHPSHLELSGSLHLKESHYASFALKDVSDFEWCSFICRPSSISLSETENSYRSPFNFCFLSHGPPVVFASINSDRQRPPTLRSDPAGAVNQPKYRYLRSVILHDKKTSTR